MSLASVTLELVSVDQICSEQAVDHQSLQNCFISRRQLILCRVKVWTLVQTWSHLIHLSMVIALLHHPASSDPPWRPVGCADKLGAVSVHRHWSSYRTALLGRRVHVGVFVVFTYCRVFFTNTSTFVSWATRHFPSGVVKSQGVL